MTRNSRSMIAHEYHVGMDVVCMYDHQMHDKLNYLDRYKVLSVECDVAGSFWLVVIARNHKEEQFPAEYFVPLWYFEGKDNPVNEETKIEARKSRADERAAADPQPVVKRTDVAFTRKCPQSGELCHSCKEDDNCTSQRAPSWLTAEPVPTPGVQEVHYTSLAESAYDEADMKRQAQLFENVPDLSSIAEQAKISDNLAKMGKNPKQQYADKKPRLTLAPMSAQIAQVEAQLDGKLKYGEVNWRINRIEALTYVDAALRHLRLYENGENYARDTKVYNLGAVMACCAILIDAELHGMLDDNRKLSPATCDMLHARGEEMTKALQEMQKERDLGK